MLATTDSRGPSSPRSGPSGRRISATPAALARNDTASPRNGSHRATPNRKPPAVGPTRKIVMLRASSWANAVGSCSAWTTRRSAANSAPPASPVPMPWTNPTTPIWATVTFPVTTAATTVPTAAAWTIGTAIRIVLRENRSASAPPSSIVTRPPMLTAAATTPAPAAEPVTESTSSG